ncbi:MAG: GMC family oxidoreductase N-terminal domain-containing protein [Anaerolineales bacterium]|nr:GMC family oxidoreductase N-terminal domain-containing protein [Anaerolineales bacterium]
MTHFLTDPQYATLVALCDAIIPAVDRVEDAASAPDSFWKRKASDLEVPRWVTRAVRDLQSAEQQAEFKQLLDALNQPFTAGLITGHFQPFTQLTPAQQEQVLQKWAVSPLGKLRQGFQAVKRLTTALYYSVLDEAGANPNWAALNYQPPARPNSPSLPSFSNLIELQAETELSCDAVVIGSGAGGGVAAAELARAGKHVIVVEKGGYYREPDFNGAEFTAYERLYENQAVLATRDLGVIVLAGSALGGGTVINWAACLRTPEHVRAEWEQEYACSEFTASTFNAALDAVSARLGVNETEAWPSKQAQILERACDRLGLGCGVIPQNRVGCDTPDECGWCCLGCARGSKQSTPRTYLQDAAQHGAQFLVNAHVEKVLIENGRAVGVQVQAAGRSLTIHARATVLAAGSLHSPAVLLRSGLTNSNIGANLRLHPTLPVFGDYEELIEPWRGPMLTRYVPHLTNLDGHHYGVVIEHPPAHPSLIGLGLPWLSGAQHKASVARAAHRAIFIAITRDRDGGRVTVDKQGRPVLHYQLSKRDGYHLMRGLQECFRLHQAAGATEIGGTHSGLEPYRAGDLEMYLHQLEQTGFRPNSYNLFSAHQMGTCRMGGHRSHAVLTPQGEAWDVRNLFVADASAFPTASGVNPMLTIMAVAHLTAQAVKARL